MDSGTYWIIALCFLGAANILVRVWGPLKRRWSALRSAKVRKIPTCEDLRNLRHEGGHPASGHYCPWCGVDKNKDEPCDQDRIHGTIPARYCHICRADAWEHEACDAGLHS